MRNEHCREERNGDILHIVGIRMMNRKLILNVPVLWFNKRRNIMQPKVVTFATIVCLIGMMASADAAPNRGTPGSQERKDWCDSKLRGCYDAAKETCEFTYPPSTSPDCISARKQNCDSSYGSNSTCLTAARTVNPNLKVPQGQLAPLTVQPSQPPVQRAPMAPLGEVMRRGVEGEQPTSSEKEGK